VAVNRISFALGSSQTKSANGLTPSIGFAPLPDFSHAMQPALAQLDLYRQAREQAEAALGRHSRRLLNLFASMN
jgi:hypothetical protein